MSKRLYDTLQECLAALESGEALESVLARFPESQADLLPLLEAARAVSDRADLSVSPEAIQRSRTRVLGHAAKLGGKQPARGWFRVPRAAIVVLTAVFTVIIGTGGLLSVSAQALPGDPLYAMKRTVETVSLSFTSNEQSKQALQQGYDQRRKDETLALLKMERIESVTFVGTMKEIQPDFWLIDEIRIQVTDETKIIGEIEIGMGVEVTGVIQPGGWVEAKTITLRRFQISGVLQQDDELRWMVNDTSFRINDLTLVEDDLELGDVVMVLVEVDESGDWIALAVVKVEDNLDTPDNEATPEPEGLPTEDGEEPDDDDDPLETAEPTHETEDPEDTDTPEPNETHEPEDTEVPKDTEEPDHTPDPDDTPEPDDTGEPEDTPDPEGTPDPSDAPDD